MAKYNKLAGKHILIIGGSKGIGRGAVEASLEAGARVTLVGSSTQSAASAIAEVKAAYPSAQITGLACDLSKDSVEQDLDALFVAAKKAGGEIDHVVHTAADPLLVMPVDAMSLDKIRQVAHMRLAVPALLGKVAARHLRKTNECSLTITTGGIADRPAPGWSIIAFMAAGLTGLTRNLALDLAPLRVNAVEPGFVDTGLWEAMGLSAEDKAAQVELWSAKLPTGKAGQVADVAEAYVYLMKDGNATGEVVKTRGGANLI
ncbi:NAD(P)-binding protein [Hypoxylon crocopeplum]|nr:NAD(P)-binding protein [Hypoxylon crocopeplum]